ncbi:MAG: hypothetical protein WBF03_01685 [Xanthobacteraceae bacterium]
MDIVTEKARQNRPLERAEGESRVSMIAAHGLKKSATTERILAAD